MRLIFASLLTALLLPAINPAQAEPRQPVFKPVITQTAQPTTIRHIRLKIRSTQVMAGY